MQTMATGRHELRYATRRDMQAVRDCRLRFGLVLNVYKSG